MKYLLLILLPFIGYSQGCLKVDIVLLVDVSASVSGQETFIQDAIHTFNERFKQGEANVALITFSNEAQVKYHLGEQRQFEITTDGVTDLESGLQLTLQEFTYYGRKGYRKIVIVISDGDVDGKEKCKNTITTLKSVGIAFYGVQVGLNPYTASYRYQTAIEFMKQTCDVYAQSDYQGLADQLLKLDTCF